MTKRAHMPLSVKLQACLYLLGFTDGDIIEWHHTPALGLRRRLDDGAYDPAENDPHHIVPLTKGRHAVQTRGKPATTAGSDIHAIAKVKRVGPAHEAFRARLLAKGTGEAPPPTRKRKIPSRPFPKRVKEST